MSDIKRRRFTVDGTRHVEYRAAPSQELLGRLEGNVFLVVDGAGEDVIEAMRADYKNELARPDVCHSIALQTRRNGPITIRFIARCVRIWDVRPPRRKWTCWLMHPPPRRKK